MTTAVFEFRFPDKKKGIVEFDVSVEAEDEMQALGKLVQYITELKVKNIFRPPIPISNPADPKIVGQELLRRLNSISDPIAYILTVHLFCENWLNQILLKFCPGRDLTGFRFHQKLDVAKGIGKLTDDLHHNLTKLNSLRNQLAHRLDFDPTKMDKDYRGCPEDFELRDFHPTWGPSGNADHFQNVLVCVMVATYMQLHKHCVTNLGFRVPINAVTPPPHPV